MSTERPGVERRPGLSVRLQLTLSYAGFLMAAGVLLIGAFALFLTRYRERAQDRGEVVIAPSGGELLRDFAPLAGCALVFLLVFGLAGGWLLAGRVLDPLTRITAATRRAGRGSLSHRIALSGRRDEFRELADSFDAMLGQLEAHVDEQRRFAANASHELRTPLAITRSLLDVARQDPAHPDRALDGQLRTVNERAIALTEALLLLSRAEGRSLDREAVDLSLAAEEATETLVQLAADRRVSVEVSGGPAVACGSRPLLTQLATNLLHNAIVHNAPDGGTAWLRTREHRGEAEIRVENTGPVVDPATASTLVEPFRRGVERVRDGDSGVGLGLAIVASITRAHHGTWTITPRPDGGLRVTVSLPAGGPVPCPRAGQ